MKLIGILFVSSVLLYACSISRKMSVIRENMGISLGYVFTHRDSLFLTGPTQWYFHDYKKGDSVNVTNTFVNVQVWIRQVEITNKEYNTFLADLLNDSLLYEYELYNPNPEGWSNLDSENSFYINLKNKYHSEKEFYDYPVVNITRKGMVAYINWLNKNEPSANVIYKLPDEIEWKHGFNNTTLADSTYSWGNNYCRNQNNILSGNFWMLNPEQWRYNQVADEFWCQDSDSIGFIGDVEGPLPSFSYNPSMMGTYNMSGNVAEVIAVNNDMDSNLCWTKGGSWHSPPYYGRKHIWERYKLPSPCVGFRTIMYVFEDEKK